MCLFPILSQQTRTVKIVKLVFGALKKREFEEPPSQFHTGNKLKKNHKIEIKFDRVCIMNGFRTIFVVFFFRS